MEWRLATPKASLPLPLDLSLSQPYSTPAASVMKPGLWAFTRRQPHNQAPSGSALIPFTDFLEGSGFLQTARKLSASPKSRLVFQKLPGSLISQPSPMPQSQAGGIFLETGEWYPKCCVLLANVNTWIWLAWLFINEMLSFHRRSIIKVDIILSVDCGFLHIQQVQLELGNIEELYLQVLWQWIKIILYINKTWNEGKCSRSVVTDILVSL